MSHVVLVFVESSLAFSTADNSRRHAVSLRVPRYFNDTSCRECMYEMRACWSIG